MKSIGKILLKIIIFILIFGILSVMFFIFFIKNDPAMRIGNTRYNELSKSGVKVDYSIYSDEEIKEDKSRENVTLQYFPGNTNSKFVIICPGGGYFFLMSNEGSPVAAKFNEEGITAFVLNYRVGKDLKSCTVYDDLSRPIKFIFNHSNEFNIDIESYALCGFSVGGHMVTTFASDSINGYKKYNVKKPDYLIVGYPCFMYKSNCANWLLRNGCTKEEYDDIDALNVINSNFPKVYLFQGNKDCITHCESNAMLMNEKLIQYKIPHKFVVYEGLNHSINIGLNTNAEGWIKEAVDFWNK